MGTNSLSTTQEGPAEIAILQFQKIQQQKESFAKLHMTKMARSGIVKVLTIEKMISLIETCML